MQFRNEYYFLSNMYPCSISLKVDETTYNFSCVEAAFQAMKCKTRMHDFEHIDGYKAKKLGKTVTLRPDWESVKLDIMESLLKIKFANPTLQAQLQSVNKPIIEENTWHDTYWGVCNGKGQNNLGKLLEKIKKEQTYGQ